MTDDVEQLPNVSINEDDDDNDVEQLSLSSASEHDKEINDILPNEFHETLQINEDDEDELTKFILKAQQEGYNCLDLSKKNIIEFPRTLLSFPSLQYLYLEGNQLAHLPDDLFRRLPNLKWLDLRNNQLTHIPIDGLDRHSYLRYLLLGGNLIRKLPAQLGKVKGLSALNLDGNPLDHPPLEIVKQGIKSIQEYLREGMNLSENENEYAEFIDDVWASDGDEENKQKSRSPHNNSSLKYLRKTKKPKVVVSTDPIGDAFAARAQEEQRLIRLKHQNMKINEELQKVKTQDLLHNWKEDYRTSQQQLRRKRLVKGKDYSEAVVQAPFGIDPHYIPVMTKDQQEMVEKAIRYESRRNRSPESVMREEEERRIRDRQIQERIREITGKMMRRRNGVRGNATEEKHQAELEIRELKKLESEVKQRRTQIDKRFKAYTGDVKARKKF